VVHAEVWPSLLPVMLSSRTVKDKAQVCALPRWFSDTDARGELERWFGGPTDLTEAERQHVINEEGWILGV
jgi:hypothetical protein